MGPKLGEILVAGRHLSPEDLKRALEAQLAFGGRLGTNLLALGLLDEETLARVLHEQRRVEVATPPMLEAADPRALRLLPAAVAARHRVVPFALRDGVLKVAMADPTDPIALDEIRFHSGCPVVAHLAPEVRVVAHLERRYGIAPDRRAPREAEALRPLDLDAAASALADAATREDVGEALLGVARRDLDRVVLWLVRDGEALGWMAELPGTPAAAARTRARQARASLAEDSALAAVVASGGPWSGAWTSRPGDAALAALLGEPASREAVLVPVRCDGRVAAVLMGDAPGRPAAAPTADLLASCEKAGLALDVLLLRSRIRRIESR